MNIPRFQSPDDTIPKTELEAGQISGWYYRKQAEIARETGTVLQTANEIDRYLEAEKWAKEIDNEFYHSRTS